jgi:hypothetical protein
MSSGLDGLLESEHEAKNVNDIKKDNFIAVMMNHQISKISRMKKSQYT